MNLVTRCHNRLLCSMLWSRHLWPMLMKSVASTNPFSEMQLTTDSYTHHVIEHCVKYGEEESDLAMQE